MRARLYIVILTLGFIFLFQACKPYTPSANRGLPKEYTTAYQQIYGHCYDSIAQAVVLLDLYSEGLELDKDKHIKGTGYNLCITDVFVPDSLLEEGSYRSDDTGAAFTFLPGKEYEGYPHGMYYLNIEDDQVIHIQVLDSGSFVYRNDSLLFTLYFKNAYGSRATYTCSFHGTLIPWLKR